MFLITAAVLFIQIVLITCQCNTNTLFRESNTAIILLPHYGDYKIITNPTGIEFLHSSHFKVFCPGRIHQDYYGQFLAENTIDVRCENDEFKSINGATFRDRNLHCKQSKSLWRTAIIERCNHFGITLEMPIMNTRITLAEFCYDPYSSTLIFTHYKNIKKSSWLQEQLYHNFYSISRPLNESNIIFTRSQWSPIIINTNSLSLKAEAVHFLDILGFELDELVSSTMYSRHFEQFIPARDRMYTTPWWRPLKYGNWKYFEKLLQQQAENGEYEIFAGQSHEVKLPKELICSGDNIVKYRIQEEDKNIPLYIWNYILPLNTSQEKDFVVIGINSPFLDSENVTDFIICKDICDEIEWMKPLSKMREKIAFGYIFCCETNDVQDDLYGFPKSRTVETKEDEKIQESLEETIAWDDDSW